MNDILPKYAQPEIERRMLVRAALLPDLSRLPCRRIEDRYLNGGRLRLRKVTPVGTTQNTFKLCKKYGKSGACEEPIVNIYLSLQEYESLRRLPGNDLLKHRYAYEFQGHRFSIDEHTGALAGLYLCEAEVASTAILDTLAFPPFAVEDVTTDPRYFGASLARSSQTQNPEKPSPSMLNDQNAQCKHNSPETRLLKLCAAPGSPSPSRPD